MTTLAKRYLAQSRQARPAPWSAQVESWENCTGEYHEGGIHCVQAMTMQRNNWQYQGIGLSALHFDKSGRSNWAAVFPGNGGFG
jgi:hypothetical protein